MSASTTYPDLISTRTAEAGEQYMRALRADHDRGLSLDHGWHEAALWVSARSGLSYREAAKAYGAEAI